MHSAPVNSDNIQRIHCTPVTDGVVTCHQASTLLGRVLLGARARGGQPAMGFNTRYASNTATLQMERAAADPDADYT